MTSTPWRAIAVPEAVTGIPNMLSLEEKQHLIWVTEHIWRGPGAIVDLGPWLGCSSAALAEGVRRSGKRGIVHAFDLFEWRKHYMDQYLATGLPEGADFSSIFAEQTAAYSDLIEARRMDLYHGEWTGGPIEILFVDAAKTWGLTNAILRVFASSLVPGQSIVVLQDCKHMPTFWLPLVFQSRPDLWEELFDLEDGDTTTFRLKAPIDPSAGAEADYSRESFSIDEVERIYAARLAAPGGHRARGSYFRALLEYGLVERAQRYLDAALADSDGASRMHLERQVEAARAGWAVEVVPRIWSELEAGHLDAAERLAAQLRGVDDPRCAVVLGRIAQLRGDHVNALARLERAIELEPDTGPSTMLLLAQSRIASGQHARASAAILDVLRGAHPATQGVRPWAFHLLRQCWDAWREVVPIRAACDELVEHHSGDSEALLLVALVDCAQGHHDVACERLRRVLTMDAEHREAADLLAHIESGR